MGRGKKDTLVSEKEIKKGKPLPFLWKKEGNPRLFRHSLGKKVYPKNTEKPFIKGEER